MKSIYTSIIILGFVFFGGVTLVEAATCCPEGDNTCLDYLGTGYNRVCVVNSPPTAYFIVNGSPTCNNGGTCYFGPAYARGSCVSGGKYSCSASRTGIYHSLSDCQGTTEYNRGSCYNGSYSCSSTCEGDGDYTSLSSCAGSCKVSDGSFCTANSSCSNGECNMSVNKCQNGCAGSSGLGYNCWCEEDHDPNECGGNLGCSLYSSDRRCKKTACSQCSSGSECMNGVCNPITGICDTNWTCDSSCTLNASAEYACTSSVSNRYACSCYTDSDCNTGLHCDHSVGCSGLGLCYRKSQPVNECSGSNSDGNAECEILNGNSCYTCDTIAETSTTLSFKKCVMHAVNGSCGSRDGDTVCSQPSTSLCSSGTVSWTDSDGSDGTFNWRCLGSCGGSYDSCTATKKSTKVVVNGLCDPTNNGQTVPNKPTSDLCSQGTPSTVTTSGTTYSWTCTGTNGVCPDTSSTNPSCTATQDTAPSLVSTVLQTSGGTTVAAETGNRNHICQTVFGGNPMIRWLITGSDVQGVSDISTMVLRFRSGSMMTTTAAVTAVAGVATFVIDTSAITPGLYNVEVQINDVHTPPGNRGWIDTGRTFKIWDCLVGVSGTIYDGSDVPISCSGNSGYTTLAPSEIDFELRYSLGSNSPRNMVVNSPNFASGDKLYWNSNVNYQPVFPGFPGSAPNEARINGNCVSGASLDPKLADAYAANPSLNIEYSSVMDQEAWYQVIGGSIMANNKVTNYVPVTCKNDCQTVINNIIWAKTISMSDRDQSVKYDGKNFKVKYSYVDLRKQYFISKGVGTTFVGNKKITDEGIKEAGGVIFVEGNLTIDSNIDTNNFMMLIVSGDIIINPNVTKINAILMGTNVVAGGEGDNQLVINGMVYGVKGVKFNRSFSVANKNNTEPSVKVVYNPGLLFMVPKEIIKSLSQWKVN